MPDVVVGAEDGDLVAGESADRVEVGLGGLDQERVRTVDVAEKAGVAVGEVDMVVKGVDELWTIISGYGRAVAGDKPPRYSRGFGHGARSLARRSWRAASLGWMPMPGG